MRAARQQFADHGYDRATIRSIAADAGVDPALVHHFYGSKEGLFAAAMRLPVVPGEVIAAALAAGAQAPGQGIGEYLVNAVLGLWDDPELRIPFVGLLRSAMTSEKAAAMLGEFVTGTILGPVARAAAERPGGTDGQDAEFRAAMVASQMLGLAVARYVLAIGPAAAATPADLAAAIGPTVERYLTGQIRRP